MSKEFCFICIPFNEFIVIPFLVPDYVDREVVFLLFLIINLHTLVFSQCNKGVACYIGIGIQILGNGIAFVVCYSTLTTTKYFASKVGCIHINMCVAFYLCQVAATIDIAIYIWSQSSRAIESEVGIAQYFTYNLWLPCVVLNIRICCCTLFSTITTSKHVGSDVSAIANNNVCSFLHYSHVATAIDVIKECSTINLNCRRAI